MFKHLMTQERKYEVTKRVLRDARIGRKFWRSQAVLIGSPTFQKSIVAYITNLPGSVQRGECLTIYGSSGSGRTSAAVVVAKETMARGGSVLYLQESELWSVDRTDILHQEGYLELVYGVDALIVDDVGSSEFRGKPHVIDVVKRRVNNCMSTFTIASRETIGSTKYAELKDILNRSGIVIDSDHVEKLPNQGSRSAFDDPNNLFNGEKR